MSASNNPLLWFHQTIGNKLKPPVIFLHGFMGHGADWKEIANALAQDYYCILPDLPGHGENIDRPLDQQISFETLSLELNHLVSQLGLSEFHLLGYSLGGRTALNFALKYPHKLKRLILESASPGIEQPDRRQARLEQDRSRAEKIRSQGISPFVDDWYQSPLFESLHNHPQSLSIMKEIRKKNHLEWIAKIIVDLSPGIMRPLWDHLPSYPKPCHLFVGGQDHKYSLIISRMQSIFPNSSSHIFPNAGHNIHFEAPEEFIKSLKSILKT